MTLPGPGSYRLLVHGKNRDDGDPVETYLLQLWPAPLAAPVTHRATSAYGATMRETAPAPTGQHPDWYDQKTSGYGPDHPAAQR
uniref:Uncharacterized protein n=1 Tax=Streptomyces sp. NBC_00003 TaxID=2903608 RepID=A0AAU2UZI6_9ACTN